MEDDDAFLRELQAFLGDADALAPLQETEHDSGASAGAAAAEDAASPQAQRASLKGKRRLVVLCDEVERLSDELVRLRRSHGQTSAKDRADRAAQAAARRERVPRAARGCVRAGAVPPRTQRNVPRFSMRVDMCRFLHFHIRLPRDRSTRWRTFDTESHNTKMRLAIDFLCRETEAISVEDDADLLSAVHHAPYAHCELADNGDIHTMTFTSVYTIDTRDLGAVARGTCVAIRDVMTQCPTGHSLSLSRDIVDADASAAGNILYRVMGVRHRNAHSGHEIQFESNVITSYKLTDDYAVVMWDFVDDDELHPEPEATNVTREITGACLVRREMCGDGVERTLARCIYTKRFRFHDRDAPRRLGCGSTEESMYGNEQLFRKIVEEQVATEEALLAKVTPPVAEMPRAGGAEAGHSCTSRC